MLDRRHLPLVFVLSCSPVAPLLAQGKDGAKTGPLPDPGLGFVLEAAFEGGGDKLLELTFTNGHQQVITAGQGGTFAAGLQYRSAALPRFSVAATIGYKYVTTAAENASITFTRIPVEVTGRWSLDDGWWVGAGIVRHGSIALDGDGFVPDVDLDPAQGVTLELGHRWFALTYTKLEYTDPAGTTFDAGSFGVALRWVMQRH